VTDNDYAYYSRFKCPEHGKPYWQCGCEPDTSAAKPKAIESSTQLNYYHGEQDAPSTEE
jgi:hypothetical protein